MSYTKFPNDLFDDALKDCSPEAFTILAYIVRKTIGWGKYADIISYSQIRNNTQFGGNSRIKKALDELYEKRFVKRIRRSQAISYGVHDRYQIGNQLFPNQESAIPKSVTVPLPNQESAIPNLVNTKETNKDKENLKKGPQTKDVFERVWHYVIKGDARGLMANEDEKLVTAVRQFGWRRLCESDPNKKQWTKKDFMGVYRNVTI